MKHFKNQYLSAFTFVFLFVVFCYSKSYTGEPGCDAKHGNPFGPFWDTFNIDFDASEFYEPLSFDTSNRFEVKRWQEKYVYYKYHISITVHVHKYIHIKKNDIEFVEQ